MSIFDNLKDKLVGTPRDKEAEKFLKTRFEKESVEYKKLNSGISLSHEANFLIVSDSIVAYLDKSVRADDLYVSNDKDKKQIKIVSLLAEPFIYRKNLDDGSTIELKCKQATYKVI